MTIYTAIATWAPSCCFSGATPNTRRRASRPRHVDDLRTAPGAPKLQANQSLSELLLAARGEIWVDAGEARKCRVGVASRSPTNLATGRFIATPNGPCFVAPPLSTPELKSALPYPSPRSRPEEALCAVRPRFSASLRDVRSVRSGNGQETPCSDRSYTKSAVSQPHAPQMPLIAGTTRDARICPLLMRR